MWDGGGWVGGIIDFAAVGLETHELFNHMQISRVPVYPVAEGRVPTLQEPEFSSSILKEKYGRGTLHDVIS